MASPHVLYYCPCNHAHSNAASTSSTSASSASSGSTTHQSASSFATPPPGLPAYSPASRYAFHPLESLYFCDECDQIRCNRCVTVDIASYYCPNCLFEVPGASVKAEKNRCARNCFECPCCQHTLSVLASDLASESARSLDLTDPVASQGEPPFYLGCSFCRWDSKSIGLVFEKPTGLSLQLQRTEDNAPDVLEFDRLKDHFDPYLKAQTQAAITSAAIGSASAPRSRSQPASSASMALSSKSSSAPSSRSARANAARNAATAALQSSQLLRDLPHLAHSKHLASAGLTASNRSQPIEPDELKTYRALNPWQPTMLDRSSSSGHVSPSAIGVMAMREKHRRDYLALVQSAPSRPLVSLDHKLSSLEQRWSAVSIADQPLRAAELRPTRVPLKSKLSKRCPACRHIVIKPDIKAASNRFKIKLVALNFLPEIQISLAPQQPYLDPLRFRTSGISASNLVASGASTSSLRRRPPSMLLSQSATATKDPSATTSSIFASSSEVDVNALIPGQTYSFQISIVNPLDDPVQVDLSFVRFAHPAQSLHATSSAHAARETTVQPFPEAKYIFSSAKHHKKDPDDPARQLTDHPQGSLGDQASTTARRPRLGWQVYPSATSVPLNAFNEVWELEESEDLYASKSEPNSDRDMGSYNDVDSSQRGHVVKTAIVRNGDGNGPSDDAAWLIHDEQSDENDDGFDDSDDAAERVRKDDSTFPQTDQKQEAENDNSPDTQATQRPHRNLPPRRQYRRFQPSSSSTIQRKRFVQKGHTTTLYLDLAISSKDPPRAGPLELAMQVAYRFSASAANQDNDAGSTSAAKDFSFWTSLRLGTVIGTDSQS